MRLAPTFGTLFVPTAFLAASLGVSAVAPATAGGLVGGSRASFMKAIVEGCIKNLAAEAETEKMPKDTLVSVCRCSVTYIADHVTPAQLEKPDTLEMRAIIAEATSACLDRRRRHASARMGRGVW